MGLHLLWAIMGLAYPINRCVPINHQIVQIVITKNKFHGLSRPVGLTTKNCLENWCEIDLCLACSKVEVISGDTCLLIMVPHNPESVKRTYLWSNNYLCCKNRLLYSCHLQWCNHRKPDRDVRQQLECVVLNYHGCIRADDWQSNYSWTFWSCMKVIQASAMPSRATEIQYGRP